MTVATERRGVIELISVKSSSIVDLHRECISSKVYRL